MRLRVRQGPHQHRVELAVAPGQGGQRLLYLGDKVLVLGEGQVGQERSDRAGRLAHGQQTDRRRRQTMARLLLDALRQLPGPVRYLGILALGRFAQLRQTAATQGEQFRRRRFPRSEVLRAELGEQAADLVAVLGRPRPFADGGQQSVAVGVAPPGGPGVAADLAGDLVLALEVGGRRPFAGQLRQKLLNAMPRLDGQIRQQFNKYRDGFGVVGLRQGQSGAQTHARSWILEEMADGGDLVRRIDAAQGDAGGGTANGDRIVQAAQQRRLRLAVGSGDGGESGGDGPQHFGIVGERQVVQQRRGAAFGLALGQDAGGGGRQRRGRRTFQPAQAVGRAAGDLRLVEVVGGAAQDGHGERTQAEKFGRGQAALAVGRSGELAEQDAEVVRFDVGACARVEVGKESGAIAGQTGLVQRLLVVLVGHGSEGGARLRRRGFRPCGGHGDHDGKDRHSDTRLSQHVHLSSPCHLRRAR